MAGDDLAGGDAGPPEFVLVHRLVLRDKLDASSSLQPFQLVETCPRGCSEALSKGHTDHMIYKSRRYRLRARDGERSRWVGRPVHVELFRLDDGANASRRCCAKARAPLPFRDERGRPCGRLACDVDRFGETSTFQLDSCRMCHRRVWFDICIKDAETGERALGALHARVRSRPPPPAASCWPPPPVMLKTEEVEEAEPPSMPKRRRQSGPDPMSLELVETRDESDAHSTPSPTTSTPLVCSARSPASPPSILDGTAGLVHNIIAASEAEPRALKSLQSFIWRFLLDPEARSWHWNPPWSSQQIATPAPAPPRLLPQADPLERLFARFAALSVEPEAEKLRALMLPARPTSPAAPAPDAALAYSFASVRPPYWLTPQAQAEILRQVREAEVAGAGLALAVLLGDPRILGTELFRSRSGWIRMRNLLHTIRLSTANQSRRRLFESPPADAVPRSLATALLSQPLRYGTMDEFVRACENIWHFVLVFSSDHCISVDNSPLAFEEVLALMERARHIAEAGLDAARAAEDPERLREAEILHACARLKIGSALRQFGHLHRAKEYMFEAWDILLRVNAYPHRTEAETLRQLSELLMQLEQVDLARHFAEKLYWFEEEEEDIFNKSRTFASLGYVAWHEGAMFEATEQYKKAAAVLEELIARGGPETVHYTLALSRMCIAIGICEAGQGKLVSTLSRMNLAFSLHDPLAAPDWGEYDLLSFSGVYIWRPDGFGLRHALKVFRAFHVLVETRALFVADSSSSPRAAHILFHIGNMYLLDGQYGEAVDAYQRAEAAYRATPELALVFTDSHRRIRRIRSAIAAALRRMGRPAGACNPPSPDGDPARWAAKKDPRLEEEGCLPHPPGFDVELFETLRGSYTAVLWHQIQFWCTQSRIPSA